MVIYFYLDSARQTLTHSTGGLTRQEAHANEMNLSPAEEDVLKSWTKAQGRRGFPLTHQTLRQYASVIAEKDVGVSWSKRFLKRHPDLKVKKTTPLAGSRASALNKTNVDGFYSLLMETINEFNISDENIYNMDEKGVQLGIGSKVPPNLL
jgi:hypothetical protein